MRILSILIAAFLLLLYCCAQEVELKATQINAKSTIQSKTDTLAEEVYCSLSINRKKFDISEDNIAANDNLTDSSLSITFNKIETGFITFHIPNMFKCPCTVPTGYTSVSTNVSFTEGKVLLPTTILQNYPLQGIGFQNLNDGFNPKIIEDGAAIIFSCSALL